MEKLHATPILPSVVPARFRMVLVSWLPITAILIPTISLPSLVLNPLEPGEWGHQGKADTVIIHFLTGHAVNSVNLQWTLRSNEEKLCGNCMP